MARQQKKKNDFWIFVGIGGLFPANPKHSCKALFASKKGTIVLRFNIFEKIENLKYKIYKIYTKIFIIYNIKTF